MYPTILIINMGTYNTMKIYDIERQDGIAELISAQSSIAFVTEIDNTIKTRETLDISHLVKAGVEDDDLFKVNSILVSTVWNLNDDVFTKVPVWAARKTPNFKPTNIDHDEKQLVGGIIETLPIDENLKLIPDDTAIADLPDVYHLLVASVIYRHWQDPALTERATELIRAIEAGDKFVSMECLFRGFDYGVVTPDGTNHILARSEDTAFLTKHLRAYGGDGLYQESKIGRVLRDITFSGKGFVDRPANPSSIIFDKDHVFTFANVKDGKSLFLEEIGVSHSEDISSIDDINNMENNMTVELLNDQLAEMKVSLASAVASNKELSDKLAEANISGFEGTIAKHEELIAELQVTITNLETELAESKTSVKAMETSLAEKTIELEKVQSNFDKFEEDKKKKERKEKMGKAGLTEDEYDTFASLEDAAFDAIIETIASRIVVEASEEVEEAEASEIVEEGSEEAGSHVIASEDEVDELEVTRASLQAWVSAEVLK